MRRKVQPPTKIQKGQMYLVVKGNGRSGIQGRIVTTLKRQVSGFNNRSLWLCLFADGSKDWLSDEQLVLAQETEESAKVLVADKPVYKFDNNHAEREYKRNIMNSKPLDIVQIIGPDKYMYKGCLGIVVKNSEVDGKKNVLLRVNSRFFDTEIYASDCQCEVVLDDSPRFSVVDFDIASYFFEVEFNKLGDPSSRFKNVYNTPEFKDFQSMMESEYLAECSALRQKAERRQKDAELARLAQEEKELMRDMKKLMKLLG